MEKDLSAAVNLDLVIRNICATFRVNCSLDLKTIARQVPNVELPKGKNELTMRLRNPRCTFSITSSGKVTLTGAWTEFDAKRGARRCARIIQKQGYNVKFQSFQIVNVMATCSMPFGIRIAKLAIEYPKMCSYEPEIHPACTIRLKELSVAIKVYYTGKICLFGRSVANVSKATEYVYDLFADFQIEQIPAKTVSAAANKCKPGSSTKNNFVGADKDTEFVKQDKQNAKWSKTSKPNRKQTFARCTAERRESSDSFDDDDNEEYVS